MLTGHRAHDYPFLVRRWRAVASAAGLVMKPFAAASGYRAYVVLSRNLPAADNLYISAGIHGDEPGGTEGMITWAEANVKRLRDLPCIFFPCLNPWGLVNNSRLDEDHRDLNRLFHSNEICLISAWKKCIEGHRFSLALTLHEDYDGQGLYLYEVERNKPFWGEELLNIARKYLPVEGRTSIEGRKAVEGIVRRRIDPRKFPLLPEALYLHLHHARRTFTIETPSEFSLDRRVKAHAALINACVKRAFGL